MIDVMELERRWRKHKLKAWIPRILMVGASMVVVIATMVGYRLWHEKTPVSTPPPPPKAIPKPQTPITPEVTPVVTATTEIEPSMEFVQSFQTLPPLAEESHAPKKKVTPPPPSKPDTVVVKIPKIIPPKPPIKTPKPHPKAVVVPKTPPKVVPVPKTLPPKTLKPPPQLRTPITVTNHVVPTNVVAINRPETAVDITQVEKRFNDTPKAGLGLFLARYYYAQGDYPKAYTYAYKTNMLNDQLEESWLIFAKASVKLGRVDQAKKVLEVYSSSSGSDRAKELLNAINQGEFR